MCSSKTKDVFPCGQHIILYSQLPAREIIAQFHNFSYVGYNDPTAVMRSSIIKSIDYRNARSRSKNTEIRIVKNNTTEFP